MGGVSGLCLLCVSCSAARGRVRRRPPCRRCPPRRGPRPRGCARQLRFCYNSRNKVTVSVSELTRTGIEIIIKDINELQYEYSNSYKINKKVKNKDYTGVGYQIGENTGNSTAGFTRYRT